MTVKTYYRDYWADEISRWKSEAEDVWRKVKHTQKKIQEIDDEINEGHEMISKIEGRKILAESELKIIKLDYFSLYRLQSSMHFFTSDTAYGSALGYQLESTVPKSLLPPNMLDSESTRKLTTEEMVRQRDMEKIRKVFCEGAVDKINQMEMLKEKNNKYGEKCHQLLSYYAEARRNLSDFDSQFEVSRKEFESEDMEAKAFLSEQQGILLKRGNESCQIINGYISTEERRTKARLEILSGAQKELDTLISQAKIQKLKWEGFARDHDCASSAVQEAFDLYEMDEFPIGAFASLLEAINSGQGDPFTQFYQDVYQTRRR